jgi:hypothetical protein
MDESQIREITDRLDIIIKIMSTRLVEEGSSPIEQIKKLSSVGMSPSQIGKLLGKPTNIITAYMVRIKKKNK